MDEKKAEGVSASKDIKSGGIEEKQKSLRGFIEAKGWNPNYIKEIAEAIVKEAKKENMDLAYISEKTSTIERFIDDVVQMRKAEEAVDFQTPEEDLG